MAGKFIRAVGTRLLSQEKGQSTAEYAAMLTVMLIFVAALRLIGTDFATVFRIVARTIAP